MEWPTETLPLFVYGSLRPGMALWPSIADSVESAQPATARGRLCWHAGGEWPLLTLAGSTGLVRGDLLRLTPGDAVNRVIVDEELRYGYDARWIPVDVAGTVVHALALVWNRDDEVGPDIPGGDYAA